MDTAGEAGRGSAGTALDPREHGGHEHGLAEVGDDLMGMPWFPLPLAGPADPAGERSGVASVEELIVLFVCADPLPVHRVTHQPADGAVVQPDPSGVQLRGHSAQAFEM